MKFLGCVLGSRKFKIFSPKSLRKVAESESNNMVLHATAMERLHSSNAAKARLTAGVVAAAEMKIRRARSTAAAFKVRLTAAEEHAAALAATAREALQDKNRLIVQKCRMKKKRFAEGR